MPAGGQVFQVDPSYFGLYGIGQAAQQLYGTLEGKKQRELDEMLKAVAAGVVSKEALADWMNVNRPQKAMGYQPQYTSAEVLDKEVQQLIDKEKSGQMLSSNEQIRLNQARTGRLDPSTDVALGKQGLEKGKLEIKGGTLGLIQEVQKTYGPEAAQKFSQQYFDTLGEVTSKKPRANMQDIEAAFAERLMGDNDLRTMYENVRAFGRTGGAEALAGSEKLDDRQKQAQIGQIQASTQESLANIGLINARAAEQGKEDTAALLKMMEPTLNAMVQFGADPISAQKFLLGQSVSDIDRQNIDEALLKYQATKGSEGTSAASNLNALSLATSRGMQVSDDLRARVMADMTSEITGITHTVTEEVHNRRFLPDKISLRIVPVTALSPAPVTAGTPEAAALDQAKAVVAQAQQNGEIDGLRADVAALPDTDPRKATLTLALNEIQPTPTETVATTAEAPAATATKPTRTKADIQAEISQLMQEREAIKKFKKPKNEPGVESIRRRKRFNDIAKEVNVLRKQYREAKQ